MGTVKMRDTMRDECKTAAGFHILRYLNQFLAVLSSYTIPEMENFMKLHEMLRTTRLYLRNLCHADVDILFDYRNDSRCNLYQRYEDTSKAYLDKFVQNYSHSNFLSKEEEQHYAIVCNANNEMIGDISIFFSKDDNCFTLGITIAPLFQKQGYAYELLNEVIMRIHNCYPAADIVALIEKENEKSISLFKKLNFIEECYADSIQSYVFTIYGKKG